MFSLSILKQILSNNKMAISSIKTLGQQINFLLCGLIIFVPVKILRPTVFKLVVCIYFKLGII